MPFKTAVGLDLGASALKVVVLCREREGFRLVRALHRAVPGDVAASRDRRQQFVTEALGEVFGELKLGKVPIAVATPGQSVFIRYVKLPPVAPGKLEQIVGYEAQQQVPFPLEGVVWDYQKLRPRAPTETSIVLVAIKRELIGQLLAQLAPHRAEPEVIDHGPLAFYNGAKYNQDLPQGEVSIILDIGAKSTDLSIERDGQLCWTRSVPIGGNDFTQAISKALEIEQDAAEAMKLKEVRILESPQEGTGEAQKIDQAIRPVIEELLSEIQRSIGYFRSQLEGGRIDRVLLGGGGAQLPGLGALLSSRIGAAVTVADPFRRTVAAAGVTPGDETRGTFGVAVGLALRLLTHCPFEVNLLPEDLVHKHMMRRKRPYALLSAGLLVLIGASSSAFTLQDYQVLRQRYSQVKAELDVYDRYRGSVDKALDGQKKLESRLGVLRMMAEDRGYWLEVMLELARVLPDDAWLESLRTGAAGGPAQPGTPERRELMIPPAGGGMEPPILGERRRVPGMLEVPQRQQKPSEGESPGLTLSITGRTSTYEKLMDLMNRLEASPLFGRIELRNTETVTLQTEEPGAGAAERRPETAGRPTPGLPGELPAGPERGRVSRRDRAGAMRPAEPGRSGAPRGGAEVKTKEPAQETMVGFEISLALEVSPKER